MSENLFDKGISRRRFLQISALTAGATMLPMPVRWLGSGSAMAAANSQALAKWGANNPMRLLNVPAGHPLSGLIPNDLNGIPVMAGKPDPVFANTRMYEVEAIEFQDLLHPSMGGVTNLWGYNEVGNAVPKHLGGLVIATRGEATRIRMTNKLPRQHIIPVDPTLPGVDQFNDKIAVHLHGGEIPWICDGGPFDWWTATGETGLSFQNGPVIPTAPAGTTGVLDNIPTQPMAANQADFFYPNDQSTRLMWYHDHAHGTTRINAYAGVATAYLCVDLAQEQVASAGTFARLATPTNMTQDNVPFIGGVVPVVFQDKIFVNPTTLQTDPTWTQAAPKSLSTGSLWYEHVYNPAAFKLKKGGAFLPPPVPTSCVPEYFGDTMLANGTAYPVATVEAKPTRFMFLNACNARFLNMNLYQVPAGQEIWTDPKTGLPAGFVTPVVPPAVPVPVAAVVPLGPPMWQIGSEGGYLAAPAVAPNGLPFNPATFTGNLILGCAERADVVIDFSNKAGFEYIIYNDAPGPFPAGPPTTDYWWGNPKNPMSGLPGFGPDTRQILRIKVVAPSAGIAPKAPSATMLTGIPRDVPFLVPYPNPLPAVGPLPPLTPPAVGPGATKNFTLNEDFDLYGRLRQLVGTTTPFIGKNGAAAFGLEYLIAPTAQDQHVMNGVEVWNIYNLSADTHPMHIHLVTAQILKRQPFKVVNGVFTLTGVARGPELNEVGWKETFKMHPGEVITICMKWTLPPVPFKVPSSNRATITNNILAGTWGMGLPPGTVYNESVWHCHILEHEEHDMMRPLIVTGQNPQTPMVLHPAAVSFNGYAGGTARLFINSGTGPYTVGSNNVAVTAVLGQYIQQSYVDLTVAALTGPGTATITVTDSLGATTTTVVDIFGVAPFTATATVGGIASFTVGGGITPYAITASDLTYTVTPTATGFDVTVPLTAVVGTTVTFTITDSSSPIQSATASLTIV